jgi:hypothetical protein
MAAMLARPLWGGQLECPGSLEGFCIFAAVQEMMNCPNQSSPPLEERLAHRPEVFERLHQLADSLDQTIGEDCTAATKL